MIVMKSKVFDRLGKFIHEEYGIKMPSSKKVMVQSRLQKRLKALDMNSFDEYCEMVMSSDGANGELLHMVDLVSTNKTDFFREPSHFDFLKQKAVPELTRYKNNLRIWSAGCSSGEEPYTLAMVLSAYAESHPGFRFSILATDISIRILKKAKAAIYTEQKVEPVSDAFKSKYLMRSKDRNTDLVRIVPELRSLLTFRRLNFMGNNFGIDKPMDIIFCRNVIIYFDFETQVKLMTKFCKNLSSGGYLFIGHSENLHNMDVPLTMVAPTIYRKS